MSSLFDDAWIPETEAAADIMGEDILIEGVPVRAVVSEVERGSRLSGPVKNSGVLFSFWLTVAQIASFTPAGAEGMKGKKVQRGQVKGRVSTLVDLGGAGGQFDCGPLGDR